jgi:hypothetical protein
MQSRPKKRADAMLKLISELNKLQKYFKKLSSPSLIISIVFLSLTFWSWRKWPDILVDFGRELYIPWQLSIGKILYKDIAYLNGPFSPYFNTFLFKIFGVSLTTLVFSNLVILAVFICLLYFIIIKSCDKFTAMLSCVVFLCVFAFAHLVSIGNYNYICPYSHEMTHGTLLSILLITCFSHNLYEIRYIFIILAGMCFGIVFLGKAEIFMAAATVILCGFLFIYLSNELSAMKIVKIIVVFLIFSMIPVALFLTYLLTKMPYALAFKGIAGTWYSLIGSNVANNLFYKTCMGIDHPWQNLLNMVCGFIGILLLTIGMAVYDHRLQGIDKSKKTWVVIIILLSLGFVIKRPLLPFLLMGAPLPLDVLAVLIPVTIICIKKRTDKAVIVKMVPLALWSVFALIMLTKIILNSRIEHYGFVLAMPAVIILVIGLLFLIPHSLRKWYGGGMHFRRIAAILLIADVIFTLRVSNYYYGRKDYYVGELGDCIITYGPQIRPEGYAVAKLLKYLSSCVPASSSLIVLPEGIMINYLSRRVNPSPYINLMPPEISIYGERNVLNSLKDSNTEFIVLVHKDTSEYGKGLFGLDQSYGSQIMDWINHHYIPVWTIFHEPLINNQFGIKMLKIKQ